MKYYFVIAEKEEEVATRITGWVQADSEKEAKEKAFNDEWHEDDFHEVEKHREPLDWKVKKMEPQEEEDDDE